MELNREYHGPCRPRTGEAKDLRRGNVSFPHIGEDGSHEVRAEHRRSRLNFWIGLIALMITSTLMAADDDYELSAATFSGGGGRSSDSFFSLDATFGQPAADVLGDELFTLEAGFLPASIPAGPSVAHQPQNSIVNLGDPVLFQIAPSGDPPLQYQWRLNGVNIPGATNATYFLSSAQLTNGGTYTVVISNNRGATVSDPFKLGFTIARIVPENVFANRTTIDATNFVFIGDNTNATREAGELRHGGKPGGHSVWYKWTAPATGIATFHTTGSSFDTLLAVYTGTQINSLTTVAGNDDVHGRFLASEVRFNATQGVEYQIAVDGLGGEEGEFVISWELEVTDQVLPVLAPPLASRAIPLGSSTTFTANVTGNGLTYQWYFNGSPLIGSNSASLPIHNFSVAAIGHYSVAITNAQGRGILSDEASLEVGNLATVVSFAKLAEAVGEASADGEGGGEEGPALFRPAAAGAGGFESVSVGTIDGHTFNNNNAIPNACAACGDANGGAMQTYILQPQGDGILTIDTIGSGFDTILYVYSNAPLSQICSKLVICDNNSAPDGVRSLVSFQAFAGVRYLVGVDGVGGAKGTIYLNWKLCLAPAPFGLEGNEFVLRTPPNPLPYPDLPLYDWYRDTEALGSTVEPVFALGTPPAQAANFSVRFTTANGGNIQQVTNSLGLFLMMNPAPASGDGMQRIILPAGTPPFRLEAASVTLTNCDGGWLWLPVSDYLVTTDESSVVVTLPAAETTRLHRIRPMPKP